RAGGVVGGSEGLGVRDRFFRDSCRRSGYVPGIMIPAPQAGSRTYPQSAPAVLEQRGYCGAEDSVVTIPAGVPGANGAELSHRTSKAACPYGSVAPFCERDHCLVGKRRVFCQAAVFPTGKSVEGAHPESAVARREQSADRGAWKFLSGR